MPANKGNYTKPTEQEMEERVLVTRDMLAKGMYKGQIKKALKEKYGVDFHTVEEYLSRARKILVEELNQARDIHKSSALGFYQSVLTDPKATTGNKIQAQKRIDFILGLHAPTRVSLTDADGRTLGRYEVEAAIDNLAEGIARAGGTGGAS